MIVDKHGKILVQQLLPTRIKSMIWSGDVLFYNDNQHIKYLFVNKEKGIVKSVDKILHMVQEKDEKILFLNCQEEFEQIDIDKAEIEFKLALMHNDMNKVKQLLKEKVYYGKSIVSYVLKKKYNFLSMQLAQDKETAFYLALQADQLQEAFDLAKELN